MHTMTTAPCSACGDLDGCHLRSRLMWFREAVDRWRHEAASYGLVVPKVVCLCGSTRFKDAWLAESKRLTQQDLAIVLAVGDLDPREEARAANVPLDPALKERLDELHKRKIDLADEILVLNVGGYVGDSTRGEIEYARRTGKPVRFLEPTCGHYPLRSHGGELTTANNSEGI